ncbi:MAG TPA: hypothetical protein VHE55_01705 [Fimbriimonadaceae bacterium]|nr:hypothetical protein [Fimbriimonadaceae bacterium]
MSGKTAGYIVARGLAVWIGLLVIDSFAASADRLQQDGVLITSVLGDVVAPLAYLALAISLWCGADRFGPQDAAGAEDDPLTVRSALGLCIAGIAFLMALVRLPLFLYYVVATLRSPYESAALRGGVISCVVFALIIPFGWKMAFDVRTEETDS